MPEIKVVDLGISYYHKKQETLVFEHLNISFKNEKFNVLMGKSGCGKTTLLRSIAGLNKYAGEIYYDDKLMDKVPPYKRNISYVNQDYALYPHLTVFENVAFPLKSLDIPFDEIKERVDDLLIRLHISEISNVKPKFISGGQQQRVAIARALIKRPQLILFDEPLSNIDQELRYELQSVIKEFASKYHITIIYSTHSINEAFSLFDTITLLENDNAKTFDNVDDVLSSSVPFVKEIINEKNI